MESFFRLCKSFVVFFKITICIIPKEREAYLYDIKVVSRSVFILTIIFSISLDHVFVYGHLKCLYIHTYKEMVMSNKRDTFLF